MLTNISVLSNISIAKPEAVTIEMKAFQKWYCSYYYREISFLHFDSKDGKYTPCYARKHSSRATLITVQQLNNIPNSFSAPDV